MGTTAYASMLPANYRGALPPVGRDGLFVSESQTLFAFEVFKFHTDFVTPANSTFTGPTNVSQTAYNLATPTSPSPGNSLDSLRERLMMQAQYRNIAGTESLWVNHTVQTPGPGPNGIQWAQIDVTGGTVNTTPVQQQIYGNVSGDGLDRWMGAMGVDHVGNMAIGYSAANATNNPSIRYNGRLVSDPVNTLPQGEVVLQAGGGSQTGNCGGGPCQRWGDYSAMSVDQLDDCTFWYTTEYFSANGLNWQTRIGAFKFPSCIPTAAAVSVGGRVIDSAGVGISRAMVTITDPVSGITRNAVTNSFGNYSIEGVPAGRTYTAVVSHRRYRFAGGQRVITVNDELNDVDFQAAE
jgi:hypothetical protein